jgi:uncharacterized lipoprotein YmbA
MMRVILLGISILLLAACGSTATDHRLESLIIPDVKEYSEDSQNNVADEMASQTCPNMAQYIVDYGLLRDEVRAMK